MIDPTDSEIWFVNWLVNKLRGEATLDGSIVQLKIDRLIPDYVTHVSAGMNTGVFTSPKETGSLRGNIRGSEVGAARLAAA